MKTENIVLIALSIVLLASLLYTFAIGRENELLKKQLLEQQIPDFEAREQKYHEMEETLNKLQQTADSLQLQTNYYETILIENDRAVVSTRIATGALRAKRLNTTQSTRALDSILRNTDSVRRRLWDFRNDSLRYKDSLRVRIRQLADQ